MKVKELCKINQRKAGMSILISNKVDFRAKKITRHWKGYYNIMIKGSIYQEDSNPNCVCTKQQNCKICKAKTDRTERRNRQIHNYSLIFNTPLSTIGRTTRQKTNKDRTQQHH